MTQLKELLLTARAGGAIVDRFSPKVQQKSTQFSVDAFKSKINELGGVLKSNRFLVTLIFPTVNETLTTSSKDFAKNSFQFLCSSTALPGMNFTTSEIRRHGVGPMTFYPSNVTYSELPLSFIVDGNGKMIEFLQQWFNKVIYTGANAGGKVEDGTGAAPYEMYYKTEYQCEAIITVYNEFNQGIIEYTMHGLIPISIADTALSWTSDAPMELSATFRFDAYSVKGIHKEKPLEESRGLSLLEKITKLATIGQTIYGAAKRPQHVGDALNLLNNAYLVKQNFNF